MAHARNPRACGCHAHPREVHGGARAPCEHAATLDVVYWAAGKHLHRMLASQLDARPAAQPLGVVYTTVRRVGAVQKARRRRACEQAVVRRARMPRHRPRDQLQHVRRHVAEVCYSNATHRQRCGRWGGRRWRLVVVVVVVVVARRRTARIFDTRCKSLRAKPTCYYTKCHFFSSQISSTCARRKKIATPKYVCDSDGPKHPAPSAQRGWCF